MSGLLHKLTGHHDKSHADANNQLNNQSNINQPASITTTTYQTTTTTKPAVNQLPNQPINQPLNQPINQSIQPSTAGLTKTVTNERVQAAVPVTREVPVIEREPINQSNNHPPNQSNNQSMNQSNHPNQPAQIGEAHYETTLNADQLNASKETVPMERFRLTKEAPVMDKQSINQTANTNEKYDQLNRPVNIETTTTTKKTYL